MAPQIHLHFLLLFIAVLISCCSVLVQFQVPKNQTFQLINQGEYLNKLDGYGSTFRIDILNTFQKVTYYNTTPNAYVLGTAGGNMGGDLIFIGENATHTLGTNGNLVLADVDGCVVWQTNTANKGVTGISMQTNGNLILHDRKGKFIWQSFHHPTDTLAVGQSLKLKGNMKLVSHTSNQNSHDGPYSIIMTTKNGVIMYHNSSAGKLVQYAGWKAKGLSNVTFHAITRTDPVQQPPGPPDYQYREAKGKTIVLAITHNCHYQYYSFLILESDGNLVADSYIVPPAHPFNAH
ncbi:hypothetical protein MKX01_042580 [Papaver californicum]|nr:hypothetical protein MKX01_042580 [Papaver californicum]